MALTLNQFSQSAIQGMMDLQRSKNTISVQIDSSESGTLVAGQAVTRVNSAGGVPKVIAATTDGDTIFGYIIYDIKNSSFVKGNSCEIATGFDDVMFMTAGGALAPLDYVMPVIASKKVIKATAGKPISGYALDKASADGDLIRVVTSLPAFFKV